MKKHATFSQPIRRKNFRGKSESGIALILTLAILVMVTLLVVAFAISMRVENTASRNFNDLIKARQMAQAAVDQAVATLRNATPVVSPGVNYVTSPGAVYTFAGGVWTTSSLVSTNWTTPSLTGLVDLNQNNLITGLTGDYPAGSRIWAGWTNVTASGSSQVIGRFAYWVDDESSKVNLNVAGSRGNDLQGYTPAAIDLQSLHFTSVDQINITNYVATVSPFDTVESIKMTAPPLVPPAPGITPATYTNNQFYTTVNSTSPDITPWGDKRLNPVDVVTNNVLYPTPDSKVAAISNMLANAGLTNFFGAGQTFAAKYPSVAQIAANIIDYIDTDGQPTDSSIVPPLPVDTTPPFYLGLEQTPYLNELVISNTIAATPFDPVAGTTLTFSPLATVELWNMYANNWFAAAHGAPNVQLQFSPSISISVVAPPGAIVTNTIALTSPVTIPAGFGHNILPGGYDGNLKKPVTVSPLQITINTNIATVILNSGAVTAIYYNNAGRVDYAIIPLTNYAATVTIDATTGAVFSLSWVTACNDPRVKPVSNNWIPQGGGTNQGVDTLGSINTNTLNPQVTNTIGAISLPADGDFSCHTNAIARDRGTMYPGELSYIHTGVPWRTFWLQPQSALETGILPDWAVLDLFSGSDATNVIGRLNINSIITSSGPFASILDRVLPLTALLTNNVLALPGYVQGIAATNIYFYAVPPGSKASLLPLPATFSPNSYTMVGEVANTQSLSNTSPGSQKSDRETPVRGIANLITTRSDTFTIWAIAQAFSGANRPAEVKVQAIVQRSVDYTVAPTAVSFRTLYYRYIYN